MTTFAVQRNLQGITMEQLGAAQQAAIQASQAASAQGTPVTYIRSNFYPADQHCTCLFEGPNRQAIEDVNRAASLPFERVDEVLDLPSPQ
ncbi:nickel-binding protein [Herbaspirillum sp. GCM10030257]|uniref:nickel-binding protein n=1 Tax=Herbaspirillum sp. GCM10030257 TaxID=3273393 RepID=UPI0036085C8C